MSPKRLAIIIAIGAIFLTGCSPYASVFGSTDTQPISLGFACVLTNTDQYQLIIQNNNPETIDASQVIVAFYNSGGDEMGTDTLANVAMPADGTYIHPGNYAEFELGGTPNSCKELQWQQ